MKQKFTLDQILKNAKNEQVTKLDLSGNNIGDDGAIEIANSLKENCTLTELNLSINRVSSNGAIEIAKALKENHTLINLDLSSNKIGDDGVIKIAKALKKNHALTSLDLSNNWILTNQCLFDLFKDKSKLIKIMVSDEKTQQTLDECLNTNQKNLKESIKTVLLFKKRCQKKTAQDQNATGVEKAVSSLSKNLIFTLFSNLIPFSNQKLEAHEVPKFISNLNLK